MLPELLRFSSAHSLLEHIPESVKSVHRGLDASMVAAPPPKAAAPPIPLPMDDSDDEYAQPAVGCDYGDPEIDDDLLGALGL